MELLSDTEINLIIKQCGLTKALKWRIEEFSDKAVGFLGDHLKLVIEAEQNNVVVELKLFMKCMPRFDQWKAEYLKELNFFKKEYVMLNELFKEFENGDGIEKWRPILLFIREDLFIFEDVSQLGFKMPHHQETMPFQELKATVITLARFHAQSYVYEERKSKEHGKIYRIWDKFSEYLQEPIKGMAWRNTGRNAVIDILKLFSNFRDYPNFNEDIEKTIPILFERAMKLMVPSTRYRNAVIHRDLWTNNIFLKKETNNSLHALIVDFQTVLYASPMLDLSSVIYFNTSRASRNRFSHELINIYYVTLSTVLKQANINIDGIFPKRLLYEAYEESLIFGMTQAAIIVPIISMNSQRREDIFCDPENAIKANVVTRSEVFIDIMKEDANYQDRVLELLDEIVEKYVYPI